MQKKILVFVLLVITLISFGCRKNDNTVAGRINTDDLYQASMKKQVDTSRKTKSNNDTKLEFYINKAYVSYNYYYNNTDPEMKAEALVADICVDWKQSDVSSANMTLNYNLNDQNDSMNLALPAKTKGLQCYNAILAELEALSLSANQSYTVDMTLSSNDLIDKDSSNNAYNFTFTYKPGSINTNVYFKDVIYSDSGLDLTICADDILQENYPNYILPISVQMGIDQISDIPIQYFDIPLVPANRQCIAENIDLTTYDLSKTVSYNIQLMLDSDKVVAEVNEKDNIYMFKTEIDEELLEAQEAQQVQTDELNLYFPVHDTENPAYEYNDDGSVNVKMYACVNKGVSGGVETVVMFNQPNQDNQFVTASISYGSCEQLSFYVPATGLTKGATYTYSAYLDLENRVTETNELDNIDTLVFQFNPD